MPVGRDRDPNLNSFCLDLDQEEAARFHDDPIYQKSIYYYFRGCETCMIERAPKASHCNQCGHCVHGWDHHCAALNNCIGRRNIRAFVSFLLFSFSFALALALVSLYLLLVGREPYCHVTWMNIVSLIFGTSFVLGSLYLFFKIKKLSWNKKVAILLAGALIYLASTWISYNSFTGRLSSALLINTCAYMAIIQIMVREYLDLISRKLTSKEKVVRAKTAKELNMDKSEDFKNKPMSVQKRMQNIWYFFVERKVPESIIEV